ncbi:ribosome biogenesis protein SLX9 homolog isoform X2 [Scylla paramamosain]|uniref:ribosome biogenesis protein SLX9 homolog isoform X2 n=1 Tax=Scylla paramamosain TaxID=85552 RepID=UPI003083CAEC
MEKDSSVQSTNSTVHKMGKVRRLRQKYHASLTKKKVENAAKDQNITNNVLHQVPQIQSGATCDPVNRDNIFAGLQIKLQKLEDVPAPSHVESDNVSVTSVSQQSWSGTKADKRKKRHQELLEKIDVVRAGQIAEKNRKKREKTVITGDMHPLLNALPSLGELMASKSKNKRCDLKTLHGTPKQKTAKKETLADIQMFTSIHEDPHFIKDPFRAVALALENRVLYEED